MQNNHLTISQNYGIIIIEIKKEVAQMEKQLSLFRENLLNRMIRIYGFENEITIWFAQLLEDQEDNEINNKMLRIMVECHEKSPIVD